LTVRHQIDGPMSRFSISILALNTERCESLHNILNLASQQWQVQHSMSIMNLYNSAGLSLPRLKMH